MLLLLGLREPARDRPFGDAYVDVAGAARAGVAGARAAAFGGYGASGIGRELGRTAIDEYIEHKSTIIRTGAQAPSWVGGVGEK